MKQKSITELLIDLENCRRKLEETQKPEYIEKRVQEIFRNREKASERYKAEIENIVNMYL